MCVLLGVRLLTAKRLELTRGASPTSSRLIYFWSESKSRAKTKEAICITQAKEDHLNTNLC